MKFEFLIIILTYIKSNEILSPYMTIYSRETDKDG